MSGKTPSNALVPLTKPKPPALAEDKKLASPLQLVSDELHLANRDEVRNRLPDILGKALARIWIDPEFHRDFSTNPQKTLEEHGVFLPDTMIIEFQKPESDRPRIVVYEKKPHSKFKMRIFYLQLVMMAGR